MNRRFTGVLVLAVLSGLTNLHAVTITATYTNIQTSDNVNFDAAGNVANIGANLNGLSVLPVGKYFRFGMYVNVTNSPNSAAALWANTPTPQPADLGVGALAMTVQSTDPTGANVAAVQGAPAFGGRNTSKATFVGGAAAWGFGTDPGDVFALDPGDVNGGLTPGTQNGLGRGQVGQVFELFSANAQATPTTLGMLATPGATWFNDLTFKVVGAGPVILTPTIFTQGTNVWRLADPGNPGNPADTSDDVPPTYNEDQFGDLGSSLIANDLAVNPPPIAINPEPASMAMTLAAAFALLSQRRQRSAR
jgi:hypothetical protein